MAARTTNRIPSDGALIMLPVFRDPAAGNCCGHHNQRLINPRALAHSGGLTWSSLEKEDDMARARKTPGIGRAAHKPAGPLRLVEDPPDVRAERVRELKEQVANGTYKPDPYEIAKRLLESGF
jgi:hypothetical protein